MSNQEKFRALAKEMMELSEGDESSSPETRTNERLSTKVASAMAKIDELYKLNEAVCAREAKRNDWQRLIDQRIVEMLGMNQDNGADRQLLDERLDAIDEISKAQARRMNEMANKIGAAPGMHAMRDVDLHRRLGALEEKFERDQGQSVDISERQVARIDALEESHKATREHINEHRHILRGHSQPAPAERVDHPHGGAIFITGMLLAVGVIGVIILLIEWMPR